jgi:CRP/FNR family transcriptional regulator
VTAYVIAQRALRSVIMGHPAMMSALLNELVHQVYHLTDTAADLALYSVRARLARFLLDRVDHRSDTAPRWTHEEIAVRIGTVQDVVGRTLRTFARQGLIRRGRGRVWVTDTVGLAREAQMG